jgi:hypothetical protein
MQKRVDWCAGQVRGIEVHGNSGSLGVTPESPGETHGRH